jgi:hypothetical protein
MRPLYEKLIEIYRLRLDPVWERLDAQLNEDRPNG